MSSCERIRELIPWYANGTLSSAESGEVSVHMAACRACREELAGILRLRAEVERELRSLPRLPDGVWKRVAVEAYGRSIAHLDVGSFFLGFSLGASVRRGAVPIHGDLKVLGRKIRLFNVEQEERI
jgi:predicted anti-sigma-YlaC factor YlaD